MQVSSPVNPQGTSEQIDLNEPKGVTVAAHCMGYALLITTDGNDNYLCLPLGRLALPYT